MLYHSDSKQERRFDQDIRTRNINANEESGSKEQDLLNRVRIRQKRVDTLLLSANASIEQVADFRRRSNVVKKVIERVFIDFDAYSTLTA